MKIQIEISEGALLKTAQAIIDSGLNPYHRGSYAPDSPMHKLLMSSIEQEMNSLEVKAQVDQLVRARMLERSKALVDSICDHKVEGWIKNKVQECLRAAKLLA